MVYWHLPQLLHGKCSQLTSIQKAPFRIFERRSAVMIVISVIFLISHFLPSWEANRFSASQEIPCILWNPKVHYRIQTCPPPVPILSHLDPVHTPTSHLLKSHFINITPFTPGSPKWSLSLRFPHQNLVYASLHPRTRYLPRPSHSSLFYQPNNIWWAVQIIKLLIM
jgi:hypothetical protein